MTLQEAIEILNEADRTHIFLSNVYTYDALKLGIESLKLVERLRCPEFLRYLCLLPGETEEKEEVK